MARVRANTGSLLLTGIIIAIVGLCFAIPSIVKLSKINSDDLLKLNEASKSDIKAGEYCEITIDYYNIYACYADYVETSKYGSERTTQKYYLIGVSEDNEYFMGLRIAAKDSDDLESLCYSYTPLTMTVTYAGVIRKQTGDAQDYYEETIEEVMDAWYGNSLTADDWNYIDSISLPYYLDVVSPSNTKASMVIGFIMAAVGIVLVIVDISKKNKLKNAPTPAPMSFGDGGYDSNTFGNYSGNDMNSDNPYANPYGGDPMNQVQTPYSPGDAAANNTQTTPYQDPFYQQSQDTDTTNGPSSDSFSLKN